MSEIKERVADIYARLDWISEHHPSGLRGIFEAEMCYLQLRLICELVALATLCAHFNVPPTQTNKFLKDWNADSLLDKLSDITATGFPQAAFMRDAQREGEPHTFGSREGGLTRKELQAIYNACGRHLHRGVLRHILTGTNKIYSLTEIKRWTDQIDDLLEKHLIALPEHDTIMLINLNGDHGAVCYFLG
jgi:hypothetical protein